MKGKCLQCENYYLAMKFRREKKLVEVHGCQSPDVICMNIPGGHLFKLDAEGVDVEMLECNSFEPKKEDRP